MRIAGFVSTIVGLLTGENGETLPSTLPPTPFPSAAPSVVASFAPTVTHSWRPTATPSSDPSVSPSQSPSDTPSMSPSRAPTSEPSSIPTPEPSAAPTVTHSTKPTVSPSDIPSSTPSDPPSDVPSSSPSEAPTGMPSGQPTPEPSASPTVTHSNRPTTTPSSEASSEATPTFAPTHMSNVRDILLEVAIHGGAEWDDDDSYQAQAMHWMEEDYHLFSHALSQERIQQRYALACILFATNSVPTTMTVSEPRGWINSDSWLEPVSECTWWGITCDDDGKVANIDLPSNRLTGSFPTETAIMASSITRIDIFRNSVYNSGDEGHDWLGRMYNLRQLLYGQTNFEYAGIPPQIARLSNLEEYDCSYTLYFGKLDGRVFERLHNLEYLVLSGNAYNSSIPTEIGQLPNLEFLYVQDSFVTGDLSFMYGMNSIVELWVDRNPLGGPIYSFIGNLPNLQSWSVSECGLTGTIPSDLGQMRNMVFTWLNNNMLSGTVPMELGNLFKLQTLDLSENYLEGSMPIDVCLNKVPMGLLQVLEASFMADFVCDCCN